MLWKDSDMDGSEAALPKRGPVPTSVPSSEASDAPGWTPGPWTYAPIPGYQYVVEIEKASQIFLCAGAVPAGREAEMRANLQLAAQSPNLYAELQNVHEWIERTGNGTLSWHTVADQLERRVRTALAKARGERP